MSSRSRHLLLPHLQGRGFRAPAFFVPGCNPHRSEHRHRHARGYRLRGPTKVERLADRQLRNKQHTARSHEAARKRQATADRKARPLVLELRPQGYSFRRITQALNRRRIPSPAAYTGNESWSGSGWSTERRSVALPAPRHRGDCGPHSFEPGRSVLSGSDHLILPCIAGARPTGGVGGGRGLCGGVFVVEEGLIERVDPGVQGGDVGAHFLAERVDPGVQGGDVGAHFLAERVDPGR